MARRAKPSGTAKRDADAGGKTPATGATGSGSDAGKAKTPARKTSGAAAAGAKAKPDAKGSKAPPKRPATPPAKPTAGADEKPGTTSKTAPATRAASDARTTVETAKESATTAKPTPAKAETPGTERKSAVPEVKPAAPKSETKPPESTPTPVAPPPPAKAASPMSGVIGGVIAAAIGAGALAVSETQGWTTLGGTGGIEEAMATVRSDLSDQADSIAALQGRLEETETAIAARVEGDMAAVREEIGGVSSQISALETRIGEIEVQPIPEAELPQEVVEAYQARLDEMQAALDARMVEIEADLAGSVADIQAAAAEASDIERQAAAAANAAAARAALAELDAALDAGAPFAAPLQELAGLTGSAIPDALSASAGDGVSALAALQSEFPEAARAALAASTRAAAESGEVGGLTAFLRNQLGARSLEPREGDDPDAVLSRAEAALRQGDLDTTLAEIGALPEAGQAELAGWAAKAQARLAALSAAQALAASLNSN